MRWCHKLFAPLLLLVGFFLKAPHSAQLAFDHHGQNLAVSNFSKMWVMDSTTGERQCVVTHNKSTTYGTDFSGPVAFSPDSARFVTQWRDRSQVWNSMSCAKECALMGPSRVNFIAADSAGARLLTFSRRYQGDPPLQLWDYPSGTELCAVGRYDDTSHDDLYGISPSGEHFGALIDRSGKRNGELRIWRSDTCSEVCTIPEVIAAPAAKPNFAFSPDDKHVAILGWSNWTLDGRGLDRPDVSRIWNYRTCHEVQRLQGVTDHEIYINAVSYSADGASLFAMGQIWATRTWQSTCNLMGPRRRRNSVESKAQRLVRHAAFSPNGQAVALFSEGGTSKRYLITYVDVAKCNSLVKRQTLDLQEILNISDHQSVIDQYHAQKLAFSPDGNRLALSGHKSRGENLIKLIDIAAGVEVLSFPYALTLNGLFAFVGPGGSIAVVTDDTEVTVYNNITGDIERILYGHAVRVLDAAYSSDGSLIATASLHPTVHIWNATNCVRICSLANVSLKRAPATGVAFSPVNASIAVVLHDYVHLWDALTCDWTQAFAAPSGSFTAVAFSLDGTKLVTASSDGTASVFDVETFAKLCVLPHGYTEVNSVAVSKKHIATADDFGSANKNGATVKVWELRSCLLLHSLSQGSDSVGAVAFSPDGAWLATKSGNGVVKIWSPFTGSSLCTLAEQPVYHCHVLDADCAFSLRFVASLLTLLLLILL